MLAEDLFFDRQADELMQRISVQPCGIAIHVSSSNIWAGSMTQTDLSFGLTGRANEHVHELPCTSLNLLLVSPACLLSSVCHFRYFL